MVTLIELSFSLEFHLKSPNKGDTMKTDPEHFLDVDNRCMSMSLFKPQPTLDPHIEHPAPIDFCAMVTKI